MTETDGTAAPCVDLGMRSGQQRSVTRRDATKQIYLLHHPKDNESAATDCGRIPLTD